MPRNLERMEKELSDLGVTGFDLRQRVMARPINCHKGHMLHLVWFPNEKQMGFGCTVCKEYSISFKWDDGRVFIIAPKIDG